MGTRAEGERPLHQSGEYHVQSNRETEKVVATELCIRGTLQDTMIVYKPRTSWDCTVPVLWLTKPPQRISPAQRLRSLTERASHREREHVFLNNTSSHAYCIVKTELRDRISPSTPCRFCLPNVAAKKNWEMAGKRSSKWRAPSNETSRQSLHLRQRRLATADRPRGRKSPGPGIDPVAPKSNVTVT